MLRVLPTTNKTCLATNQVDAGCEKLLQKVGRGFFLFVTKSVNVAHFTGPTQTCFATSDLTTMYGATHG